MVKEIKDYQSELCSQIQSFHQPKVRRGRLVDVQRSGLARVEEPALGAHAEAEALDRIRHLPPMHLEAVGAEVLKGHAPHKQRSRQVRIRKPPG